jgi:hypothetical protein
MRSSRLRRTALFFTHPTSLARVVTALTTLVRLVTTLVRLVTTLARP